ncbi:zinc ABC transporter substrate-binding protein [Zhengella sp. ZM62]|uniref:zinc ABC transporter substrate-binding protein n=1 Tax=Zhengella sedimenti TaxID=3390035 RepID=UPI003976054B
MHRLAKLLLASGIILGSAASANAQVKVVTTIKPVHSLVAAVMEGVGEPALMIEGAGSPHNYALKPSQARMLETADVVFWVGPNLETFLEKPLQTIATSATAVELFDAGGLVRLPYREGATFEEHGHHAHDDGHEGHEEGGHGEEHGHDEAHDHGKKEAHDHGEAGYDSHVWLDPVNAKAMVYEIATRLSAADPGNAATYEANAERTLKRIDTLIAEVKAMIAPVRDKPFVVFHDAYRYFENRFGLQAAGSITLSPEHAPGAERIAEIRDRIAGMSAVCVFSEPQFEPKLVETVIEGTEARNGVIDPLGADLPAGPDLYFTVIGEMAKSLHTCLSGEG